LVVEKKKKVLVLVLKLKSDKTSGRQAPAGAHTRRQRVHLQRAERLGAC